jgi:hypothetical protein
MPPSQSRATQGYFVPDPRLPWHLGSRYSPGYFRDAAWIRNRAVQPFTVSILDQADNPSRLVESDDDSDTSSSSCPYATDLDRIRRWVRRDCLSFPASRIDGQSLPWGMRFTSASEGQESHLHENQVIKDLFGLRSSSLTTRVISRKRIAPICDSRPAGNFRLSAGD